MNLYCVDMTTGNVVWTTKVEGDNYTAVKFLGSDEFGNVYMNNSSSIDGDYGDKLYKIDMSSGDINMVADLDYSPITGPEGNIEYLLHLKKAEVHNMQDKESAPARVVKKAHEELNS